MSLIPHYGLSISMKEAENIGNHANLNELCQRLVHHCSEASVDTPIFQICLFLMLMEVY